MDDQAARNGAKGPKQHHDAPRGWDDAQDSLAASSGLAVLLVDGHQPPELAIANNNSICSEFQSSRKYSHLCEPFCGVAFNRAMQGGTAAHYRCHAGLHCVAVPVEVDKKQLAVIGGRAFLSTADYRVLVERFRVGDLQDLLSTELFTNVLFAADHDLIDITRKVTGLVSDNQNRGHESGQLGLQSTDVSSSKRKVARASPQRETTLRPGTISEYWQTALTTIAERFQIASLALLLRTGDAFVPALTTGRFESHSLRFQMDANDIRLVHAAQRGESLLLVETREGTETKLKLSGSKRAGLKKNLELFPLSIEKDVKGALIVADASLDVEKRQALSEFCREIALPLEVVRLRGELDKRARVADSLQHFTSDISKSDPTETYSSVLRLFADLLCAERSSLLLYDESSSELTVRAALGLRAKDANAVRVRLGAGVSGGVMLKGVPLVVRDLEEAGCDPAPAERRYKTRSFISYPIRISGRNIGVLNVTDKADGTAYDEIDLGLIEAIVPQLALALDRADWQQKAAQFQLISITDPLTGLLNRRYLEERLAEELKRCERQNYAMGFLMIDIDDFKYYNDHNGHQAGDLALEMTAQCLKSVLRAADVASRYGGEEFCILLPQTKIDEALAIAERIRHRVERTRVPHGKSQPLGMVTVSIGVSAFGETLQTPAAIIRAADRALYLAKHQGKNRVQVLDDPTDSTTPDANESAK